MLNLGLLPAVTLMAAAKRAIQTLSVLLLLETPVPVALTAVVLPHAATPPNALHKLPVIPLLSPLAQAAPHVLRIR